MVAAYYFPPYFVEHNDKISGSKTIADEFNEYFKKLAQNLLVQLTRHIRFLLMTI